MVLPNLPSMILSPANGNKGLTFKSSLKVPPLNPLRERVFGIGDDFLTLPASIC